MSIAWWLDPKMMFHERTKNPFHDRLVGNKPFNTLEIC